jgi:hypothetical protein
LLDLAVQDGFAVVQGTAERDGRSLPAGVFAGGPKRLGQEELELSGSAQILRSVSIDLVFVEQRHATNSGDSNLPAAVSLVLTGLACRRARPQHQRPNPWLQHARPSPRPNPSRSRNLGPSGATAPR